MKLNDSPIFCFRHIYVFLFCAQAGVMAASSSAPWVAMKRGPHETVWEQVGPNSSLGGSVQRTNRFVQFQSGLNYLENGEWHAAEPVIALKVGGAGASATRGQHKVNFPANINTPGGIELTTSDGKVFKGHVLGLAYFDASSGRSEMIAEVQDSEANLLPPNEVVFFDCFREIEADIRFIYTAAGLEQDMQDIVILEQMPSPLLFNMNPDSTILEVWT